MEQEDTGGDMLNLDIPGESGQWLPRKAGLQTCRTVATSTEGYTGQQRLATREHTPKHRRWIIHIPILAQEPERGIRAGRQEWQV